MSFPSAAALLVGASVRHRVRRLVKQPRNLIFLLAGGAYFAMVGGARLFSRSARSGRSLAFDASHVPPWLALMVVLYLATIWLFGADGAVLAFSEAEVHFFFTGPVTRRQLVHYKLVRSILASLASGAFFAFVLGRGGKPLFATIGFSVSFATLALHRVCASMTRQTLLEHGVSGLKRRLVTLAVVIAIVAFTATSIAQAAAALPSFDPRDPTAWMMAGAAWADAHHQALSVLLFPVAAMARVTSATSAAQFAAALPAALAVLAVHYVWAVSTDVAFEEASAEASKKLSLRREALRAGRLGKTLRTPPLFRLTAAGPPWVGIFWKNLVAGMRVSRQQLVAWSVVFLCGPLSFATIAGPGWRAVLGPMAIGMTALISVLGPNMVRNDLRQDVDHLDVLRSYPLTPRDAVLGELLAPLVMLAFVEWGLLAVAFALGLVARNPAVCFIACGCAPTAPAVTACVLVMRNLGALWLPSWAGAAGQGMRGIEAFGQRLIVLVGTLAAVAVVILPAGGAGAALAFVLWPWLGWGVAPVAGALAASVAMAEAYAGVILAGWAFERFDVGAVS